MSEKPETNLPKHIAGIFRNWAHALISGQSIPDHTVSVSNNVGSNLDCLFGQDGQITVVTVAIGVFDATIPHTHTHLFWKTKNALGQKIGFYGVYDDETISKGKLNRFDLYYQTPIEAGCAGADYHDDGYHHLTPQIRQTNNYRGDDYLDNAIRQRFLVDASNGHHVRLTRNGDIRHILSVMTFDDRTLSPVSNPKHVIATAAPVITAQSDQYRKNLIQTGVRADHPVAIGKLLDDPDVTANFLARDLLPYMVRQHAIRGIVNMLSTPDPRIAGAAALSSNLAEMAINARHDDIVYVLARDGRFDHPQNSHRVWERGCNDRQLGRVMDGNDIPPDICSETGLDIQKWREFRQDIRRVSRTRTRGV